MNSFCGKCGIECLFNDERYYQGARGLICNGEMERCKRDDATNTEKLHCDFVSSRCLLSVTWCFLFHGRLVDLMLTIVCGAKFELVWLPMKFDLVFGRYNKWWYFIKIKLNVLEDDMKVNYNVLKYSNLNTLSWILQSSGYKNYLFTDSWSPY